MTEEGEEAARTVFYVSLPAVESTPAYKVIALRGLRRLIFSLIRRAGYIAPETREELITLIGNVFDRIIGEIAA